MRFLMTYFADDHTPPTPEKMAAIGAYGAEMTKAGKVFDTGGMFTAGPKATLRAGKFSVTDGPYPETKELIVGYVIVNVKDKEEALELAQSFMAVAGDGYSEIRQIMGPADHPH